MQTINLFGYSDLPHNFICAFFGGFLYAFPTLTSIFYSFCIALNTQLVFVFSKRPGSTTLKYYVGVPVLLSSCICVPALGVGAYGYDASYDLCWYAWTGGQTKKIFTRYLFTFGLWCLVVMLYLLFAAITILHVVFSKSSRLHRLPSNFSRSPGGPTAQPQSPISPHFSSPSFQHSFAASSIPIPDMAKVNNTYIDPLKTEFDHEPISRPTTRKTLKGVSFLPHISEASKSPPLSMSFSGPSCRAATPISAVSPLSTISTRQYGPHMSRRTMLMRALAFRLLGYILIPTVCILPGVIQDILSKANPKVAAKVPDRVTTMFDSLNGLLGLFNAILFSIDPALLTLYQILKIKRNEHKSVRQIGEFPMPSREDDIEMEMANTRADPQYSVYEIAPEVPITSGFDDGMAAAHMDASNGRRVEIARSATLKSLYMGGWGRKSTRQASRRISVSSVNTGIEMRVDESVDDGRDSDLERLDRYLGGL